MIEDHDPREEANAGADAGAEAEAEAKPKAEAEAEAHARAAPERRDTSGPAIAATVALVLFSVFIGVFGPRLGNRPQAPAGVTLVELAEAMVSRSQAHLVEARAGEVLGFGASGSSRGDRGMSDEEFAKRLDDITDAGVALVYPADLGLEAVTVQRVRLPGGSGGFAVLRGIGRRDDALTAIAVIEDEDRFTVYDRYGRPIAMPEGEIFSVADRVSLDSGTVEVYRAGGYVVAVYARTLEDARRVVAALRRAEVDRTARNAS
jgi:hypothetical protein